MEISNNSLNQPVSFYAKNTGNTINMAIDEGFHPYVSNVFSPELNEQLANKQTQKKKRKSKRLNTIDTDYLPDEAEEVKQISDENNFFLESPQSKFQKRIKTALVYFLENTPLINYFYLKQKGAKIQQTVETLKDINQNVDELLNTTVPFGEENDTYSLIAKNLTNAANVLGKVKNDL